ncbi:MAG: hypothetical protein ACXVCM_16375 [Ktedonobacteraceae bacterium]
MEVVNNGTSTQTEEILGCTAFPGVGCQRVHNDTLHRFLAGSEQSRRVEKTLLAQPDTESPAVPNRR